MDITLSHIVTAAEWARASQLYRDLKETGTFARTVRDEITAPNLARINAATGQENDPLYLAYLIEYILSNVSGV